MRLGLSSFTYTWAIAHNDEEAQPPLSLQELLNRTIELNADVLQIADNLPLHQIDNKELIDFARQASDAGIRLEVGTRGIKAENISRHLEIANLLSSPILRVVIDSHHHEPDIAEIVRLVKPFEREIKDSNIKLAIENHDRLTAAEFLEIVGRLGEDWVGICLDTVNSMGCLEVPETVVPALSPLAINLHLKDFEIVRSNGNMGFTIRGTALGEGKLDAPWVISSVGGISADITAVIELWTPRQSTYKATVELEAEWAKRSVSYLRTLLTG